MSIELRAPHHPSSLRERLKAHLERSFACLMHGVKEVRATLRDVRNPEGQVTQLASVALRTPEGEIHFAEARAAHPLAALARAASRARRAMLSQPPAQRQASTA